MEKFISPLFLAIVIIITACPQPVSPETYFDFNSYLKFSQGTNILLGGDVRLSFSFRFCNDKGILLYQNRPNGYFAIGVSKAKIYVEWKMSNIVVELYIGDGSLAKNQTYAVTILNLNNRLLTSATINGAPASVEYLIVLDERLNLDSALGEVYIGGFVDVSLLPVNTERISAYLIICLDYVETAYKRIDLTMADQIVGVYNSCPADFCAPPTTITTTSTSSYVRMNVTVKARTRTHISFRFRTRAPRGMLFYVGGPAYLTLFLVDGGYLGLGLNTKAQDAGAFNYSSIAGYNDGSWKYVQIIRTDNVANVTNEQGYLILSTRFGVTDNSGYNLNADSLMIAGTPTPLTFLPPAAQVSTPGCFQAPRFVSFSIATEPASLLNFDTQINKSRDILLDYCYSNMTCYPQCPGPSQYCDLACLCSPGHQAVAQNPLVCTNIDDCSPNPCKNGATCVDLVFNYTCLCTPGFGGRNCDQISYCSSLPCKNGATCTDAPSTFTCTCAQGYIGIFCDVDLDECWSSPCKNDATCRNLVGSYACDCKPGFYGINCEFDYDECQTNPCLNGGVCVNTIGSFYCSCSNGYTGTRCEQNTNECSSNPCFNNGVCIDGPNSYLCNCPPGFSGVRCEININECNSSPCLNNGICTDGRNMFTCSCLPGYTGVRCEINIDECSSNPCRNNGVCLDLLNGYRCQCATGYTGLSCDNDINECSSNPCKNNGACVDRIGFFQCICPPGWSGSLCEVDVNECLSSPCSNGGTCYNEIGMYRCSCLPGYAGLNCQTNVNECSSNPCYNGGTCTDLINGYTCNCPPQYAGPNCGDDYNECLSYPCQNGGVCNNLVGRFTCTCLPGFTGQVCQIDVDECASSPCLNGGVCQNHVNAYYCACPGGFVGTRCESNYNECSSNPCMNGICVDGSGSYSCTCFPGWQGVRCDADVNECASNPCRNGATCENLQNRYRCVCLPGYEGTNCEININDCYVPTYHKCANGATCVDGIGTYTCICAPGWAGQFCDQDLNECNSSPCRNNGTCTNLQNAFYCTCQAGFTGPTCADDIDECVTNVCKNYVSCVNTYGSYMCTCQAGYTGKNCDSVTNPCLGYTCYFGGTCEVINNAPHCLCLPDYMGVRCEAIIRQCNYSYPCKNNAFCQNKELGGYQCFCKPGFSGMRCDINVDECASSPCYNGGSCEDLVNGFKCTCVPGYTGDMCRVDIDECISQPCQNGGSCIQPMINMYRCVCVPGYTGTNCEQIINNCASNPCQSWQICTNKVNNFTCSCPSGFTGSRCSERIDKCYSQPCLNGGTCEMIASGDFFCRCPFPWGGPVCDITTDACYPNPCLHFGTCIRNSSVVPQGYTCLCRPGFIGERCQGDIYSCFSNPCKNGAQCSEWFNGTNGFTCGCTQYYAGPFCDSPISLGGVCSSSPCLNGGTCYSTTNGFGCSCTPSWVGTRCENDVNECAATPCSNGGTCTNTMGSFTCTCPSGWTGTTCKDYSTSNLCTPNACPGQMCLPLENGTWKCCSPGIDCPCNMNVCANGGTCVNTSSTTFKCLCPLGITGDKCERVSGATFGGNSFLEIPLNKLLSSRKKRQTTGSSGQIELNRLNFSFKTVHGEGLILYLLTTYYFGYLLVELHNNLLRVAAGFVSEEVINSFPIAHHLDGNTITVSIQLSNNELFINLSRCDDVCNKKNFLANGTLFVSNIQLGLKESWFPFSRSRIRSNESLRGCLENVFINNKSIPLSNQLVGATVDNNPPKPGCQDVCTLSYCQNGGKCVDQGSSKSCQCTPSYGGNLCQNRTIVHFPDSKTFNYSSPSPISKISFLMTASDSQGLIFFTNGGNSFALHLQNWMLVLIVWSNNTFTESNISRANLGDGGWYKIETILTQTSITVSVQSSAANQAQNVPLVFPLQIPTTIFIGSPYGYIWQQQYQKGFVGCMKSLMINSMEQDWTDGRYDKDLLSCPREEGCSKTPTPCGGGICTSSWSGFTCDCLPPFTGATCSSDLAVSYKDQTTFSFIAIDAARYSFGRNITFFVKTIKENTSCIMLVQFLSGTAQELPTAYICIRIANGSLLINMTNDSLVAMENPTFLKVNTGYWTSISILPLLDTSSYIIKMNDTTMQITTNTQMYSTSRSQNVRIYMGNWRSPDTAPFFEGCISRLMFNEDDVTSLINYAGPPLTTEGPNLPRGCRLEGCNSSQCSEKGNCFSFWNQTQCMCQQGFTGNNCAQSISLPCLSNPCSNGGTCINNNNDSFSCNCQPGWTGPMCKSFDVCLNNSANQCKNGTCEMLINLTYKCKCQNTSYGRFCEFHNSCTDNPCLASGNCSNLSNIYSCPCTIENDKCITKESSCSSNELNCSQNGDCHINSSSLENYCKCKDYFNGSKCETCNYCLNGGLCILEGDKLTCNCPTHYIGLRCDTLNPCLSNPCKNGSTCDRFNSTDYTCVQSSPFNSIDDTGINKPNTGLAIGLGVGIPLFLLAALAGYLIYKREQRLRGRYKPQETEQNISLQNSRPFTVSNGVNSNRNNNVRT